MSPHTHAFQAEVAQLLHLVTHSLYSNPDIFARELISNASDACDKLRFEALNNPALYEDQPNLEVRVSIDKAAKTITIADNGIGMSEQEAIDNLGTIAKSGTKDFVSKLTGDQKADSQLIGQFGVGFYSGFIVADKITVETRRAGLKPEEGVRWVSGGAGDFSTETITRPGRGTSITLHLREDKQDYLNSYKLKSIISQYSDHIGLPILMPKEEWKEGEEGQPGDMVQTGEWEQVNEASALWTRPKKDITPEQYNNFYQTLAHDFEDPLAWSHNKVEGNTEYTQLLYIPARAPFDLYQRDHKHGLKLYVQRVFIMDQAEQFLPLYLRFLRGVVDSSDLSLNVSREILQSGPVVDSMRSALTKRALDMLEKLSKDKPEDYKAFWTNFGQVLKEGPAEDYGNREKIAGLLRFASTHDASGEPSVALADYVARMKEGQDRIYYLTGDAYVQVKDSPHLEIFRKKGIEVLLLTDRIDEWMMGYLSEFDGKSFADVARGDLDLGALDSEDEKKAHEETAKAKQALVERLKTVLGLDVADVRVSHRLTDSPAILAMGQGDLGVQMRQLLEASGQQVPESKPVFEFNPDHPLIARLDAEGDANRFNSLTRVLFDQAALAAGESLKDPAGYVKRLNALLLELSA